MPYPLSATKLVTYQQCPQAYRFRYERGLSSPAAFGSPDLGNALHQALAIAYRDWHYNDHKPDWKWFEDCWGLCLGKLSERQIQDGRTILERYYRDFVAPLSVMPRPLGIESKISAKVQFENIEFALNGRYDRLDQVDGNLEQVYHHSLKRLSLIFLRAGETRTFEVNDDHREQVRSLIADLATRLRADDEWVPKVGGHCDRCGFAKYCAAKTAKPEPLPEGGRKLKQVQLALAV
jgi:putative RecB family exonuclease